MKEYLEISSLTVSLFIGVSILFSADLIRLAEIALSGLFISFPLYAGYKFFLSLRNRENRNGDNY